VSNALEFGGQSLSPESQTDAGFLLEGGQEASKFCKQTNTFVVKQGRLEEAIVEYDQALHLNPQDAQASAYYNLGEYPQAIEDLNEAIRLNPQDANAYANRAISYTFLGQDAEAQHDIERSVELGVDRGLLESDIEEAKRHR